MDNLAEQTAALSLRNPTSTKKAPETRDLSAVPLAEAFHVAQKLHQKIQESSLPSVDEKRQADTKKAYATFINVWNRVNTTGLISDNESLDDMTTATLKYLLTPYYLADLTLAVTGVEGRLGRVNKAISFLEAFLNLCLQFGFMDTTETKLFQNPNMRLDRKAKIDQYKREKAMQQQLEAVLQLRERARKKGQELTDNVDEEDNEREYSMLLIRSHVAPALKHLAFSKQEIPMLEMMAKRTKEREALGLHGRGPPPKPKNTVKPWIHKIGSPDELNKPLPPHLKGKFSLQPANGLTAAQATSVQAIIDSKVNARELVFRDRNAPTMTPEQWAEEEMRRGNLPAPEKPHKHKANQHNYIRAAQPEPEQEDEDEMKERMQDENEALRDAAQKKAREWSNWTDDNERGIGQRVETHWDNPADRRARAERLSKKPDIEELNKNLRAAPL